jgi:hypothetical protein
MDAKRLFDARRTGPTQGSSGFFVGNIAGDENDAGSEFRAMGGDPGMDMSEMTP